MEYSEQALDEVRHTRLLINRYDRWLFEEFGPFIGERIFEVGCGLGNQMVYFLDRELVVGIDPSEETIAEVNQKFSAYNNLMAFAGSITSPEVMSLRKFHFDTAISLNVFEHIEDDRLALRNVFQLLQPGGRLVLIVPAHNWLYGTIDSAIGHYRRYTTTSLCIKLEAAGFRVITQKYLNGLGALGWWFNGRVLRKQSPPTGQLRLLNKVTPLVQALEKRFPLSFGISLLSVSEKPS